jgi:hypothetical protein
VGPLSDDAVIRSISRYCVPVAVPLYTIRDEKSPSGDFFRAVQKQRPEQYQGIYIVSPEGKVLAWQARAPEKRETWTSALVDVIETGVGAYGPVTVRKAEPVKLLPDRGVGRRKDGSIVLAVYGRTLSLGLDRRGFGGVTFDSAVLSDKERQKLEFPGLKEGDDFQVDTSAVRKLHRVLSPASDCNTLARADEVEHASLSGKVDGILSDVVYLSFQGRIRGLHTWPFPPHKGKKIYAEVMLAGVGSCERKTGKLLSLLLLGDGRYRNFPPYDHVEKYGVVVEWRLKR